MWPERCSFFKFSNGEIAYFNEIPISYPVLKQSVIPELRISVFSENPWKKHLFNLQIAIQNCIDIAAHKEDVFLEMIEARNTFESA